MGLYLLLPLFFFCLLGAFWGGFWGVFLAVKYKVVVPVGELLYGNDFVVDASVVVDGCGDLPVTGTVVFIFFTVFY